ncbi:MAG TPA: prepilin-type N-terminal cleavage/methylation domain-containing protein [Candidatus Paceibacterota bacterium]
MSFLKAKSYQLKASRGFTLIELLVVIAIIGILSSVVLASLNSARTKARDTRRVSDLKQIQVALELYYDANSKYPTTLSALVGNAGGASLAVLPLDPRGPGNELNVSNGYKYAINNATPTIYHLGAVLEQASTQTTLEDNDLDGNSTGQTPAWVTSGTDSIPFNGNQDTTTNIYDISNTKFN